MDINEQCSPLKGGNKKRIIVNTTLLLLGMQIVSSQVVTACLFMGWINSTGVSSGLLKVAWLIVSAISIIYVISCVVYAIKTPAQNMKK